MYVFGGKKRSRLLTSLLGVAIVGTLTGGFVGVYLLRGPDVVTTDEAVRAFREQDGNNRGPREKREAPRTHPREERRKKAGAGTVRAAASGDTAAPSATPTTVVTAPPATSATPTPAGGQGSPPAPTTSGRPVPESGVYRYATQGYEEVTALGGDRHDYPEESAITVTHTRCGFNERWTPLEERWDEVAVCVSPDGGSVRRFTTYHEFFQSGSQDAFACPDGSLVWPAAVKAGQQWAFTCRSDGATLEMRVRAVEVDATVSVAGAQRRVDKIRLEGRLTGDMRGTQVQERWFDQETGVTVRIESRADIELETPLGTTDYHEEFTLTLTDAEPLR